ncbi:efflux RND transporter periplasmic adaptor subunit [Limnohabitans lacus]|uniref:Efflux RND transporter periplasmic adaptor subunit n=1 Tax=Limnohabitans lacus TaxID=3045173 RepID=A0ABT6X4I8_9BURK|nr:efflux RND transporter periplasmic adaptor subunit [Limnohabitans sp. HM2-2]MDI9233032.1 efflux RND transporter periplasmic adaptor subunit [Limnohabitans sp. HM2-2]
MKTLHTPLAVMALAALTLLGACQDKPEPVAAAPLPIIQNKQLRYPAGHPQLPLLVSTAATKAQSIQIDLPAKLVWNEEKTQRVYPAFAGRVTRISADVGQTVKAGQVLAELASPEFGAAQADTSRAQADATLAKLALQRQRELFEAGVVARKDLEQAEAEAARSQAEVARAQARTSLYGSGTGVNMQLGLRSDMAGVVVERNLNPGQEVRPDSAATPLFVVSDPSVLWVSIDAQEGDLKDLRPGAKVSLNVANGPEQSMTATISAVTDQIDPSTRTIKIRATVANPQRWLKNEMLAKVRYQRQVDNSIEVPASAVFLRGNQHYVFVQSQAGVFEPRDVKVAYEGAQRVLLSEGLQEGEQVVSQNGLLLARELRIAQEAAHAAEPSKP